MFFLIQLAMFRYMAQMKTKSEGMMPDIIDMFKHEEVCHFAESVLKSKGHSKVTFKIGQETIAVYGDDDQSLSSALTVLIKCVRDQNLQLTDDNALLMSGSKWTEEKESIVRRYGKKLRLVECPM